MLKKWVGLLAASAALSACASVMDRTSAVQTTQADYRQSYSQPKVQRAEAPIVCENENMRNRAADQNRNNDTARVLILEESDRSSNIIADVQINCQDYFQNAASSTYSSPAQTNASYIAPSPKRLRYSQTQ